MSEDTMPGQGGRRDDRGKTTNAIIDEKDVDLDALDAIDASVPPIEKTRELRQRLREAGEHVREPSSRHDQQVRRYAWMMIKRSRYWEGQGLDSDQAMDRACAEAAFYYEGRVMSSNEFA